ncbi:Transcriptional regulator PadR-like family protein [Lentzea albidocapillata subsp. violacea]|uniref:Transcriptional regulator PadR-like family protein n=1 Tax=Lentzea albidocapillata subsp. violacea TaxID=128104 RepID=A0A1G9GG31_9PSEU|nr:PadR family transcriptional regulator [Lentzea albidocapillata]SDK99626.1 Transcriptional regulator PadR-like family protein [Lentzea albidocapillata subsp. violacea]
MSATRMLVLGVVKLVGEAHGYVVRRELKSWSADSWANVQPGSIYHALKSLTKDGLLEPVGTEESGEGPARTTYRITAAGEQELDDLLGRALATADAGYDEVSASVAMLNLIPRKRAIVLLKNRLADLEGRLTPTRHGVGSMPDMGKPAHVSELFRLWLVHLEGQVRWTQELIERLEAGAYELTD